MRFLPLLAAVALAAAPDALAGASGGWTRWWGTAQATPDGVALSSTPSVSLTETHSALITTRRRWRNPTITATVDTLHQLRQGDAPNPWEVGWLMFRFTSLHDYYWFVVKPSGWELGKRQGSDRQIFLATGSSPALTIGRPYHLQVRATGPRVIVRVDGRLVVDFTDPHPLPAGAVGLYEEDSQVRFSRLTVAGR